MKQQQTKEEEKKKKKQKSQETMNEIAITTYLSAITLNVNVLNYLST